MNVRRGRQMQKKHQTEEQRAEFLVNKQILDDLAKEKIFDRRYQFQFEKMCNLPYFLDKKTVEFITDHGHVLFIICGPSAPEKKVLNLMIRKKYPTSVSYDSAYLRKEDKSDDNEEGLCQRSAHPVMVATMEGLTDISRLKKCFTLALENGYIVILAIVNQKFLDHAEWKRYGLKYLGWFLCPADESFVFQQAKQALANSLGDGKLCRELDVYCEDDIWGRFKIESHLFCIATFCKSQNDRAIYHFYLSDTVQQVYGMCFTLSIHGFLVSEHFVLAVVAVTEDMKMLMRSQRGTTRNNTGDDEDEEKATSTCSIPKTKKENFLKQFASVGKTARFHDYQEGELMNINYMSFILVARSGESPDITDVKQFAEQVFSEIANNEGVIERSFLELDNGTKCRRLPDKTWFISLPKKITLSAVFTGLIDESSFHRRVFYSPLPFDLTPKMKTLNPK